MQVFISWSGDKSRAAAEILREWIPNVLQSVDPFISSQDIETGVPWFNEIKRVLDETSFGIVCLTKSNTRSPWLLYEIGALAHRVEHPNVVPILLDIGPRDIPSPISFFQALEVNRDSFWKLLSALNKKLNSEALEESRLSKVFDKWWPDLEKDLNRIQVEVEEGESEGSHQSPTSDDSLNEILELVRSLTVKTDSIDRSLRKSVSQGQLTEMSRRMRGAKMAHRSLGDFDLPDFWDSKAIDQRDLGYFEGLTEAQMSRSLKKLLNSIPIEVVESIKKDESGTSIVSKLDDSGHSVDSSDSENDEP